MSFQSDITSITIPPKFARTVTKALFKAGFKITPDVVDNGGTPVHRYLLTKSHPVFTTIKAKPLTVQNGGVYHNTVTFMVMSVLSLDESRELLHILNQCHAEVFHLGTDGGWLGFPYYLIFDKQQILETLDNMKLGLSKNDEYFDKLSQEYEINYSQETRLASFQEGERLIKDLTKTFKG